MRWRPLLLYLAVLTFLGSSLAILYALERAERWLAVVAVLGMVLSAVFFVLSIWLPARRVDWKRIEAEQRLWESGPLGRTWLKVRRRLYNLWKL